MQESGRAGAVRDEVAPCESAVRPHAAARGHPGGIFWKKGEGGREFGWIWGILGSESSFLGELGP